MGRVHKKMALRRIVNALTGSALHMDMIPALGVQGGQSLGARVPHAAPRGQVVR